jgi:lysophospholipase L1-like esterase
MRRIRRVLVIILPTLLVLLALEVGLRIYHAVAAGDEDHQQATDDWWRYDSRLGWSARPGYAGDVFGIRRVFDAEGYLEVDGRQIKASAKPKIMLIGDSCTFGHGVEIYHTFGELLDWRLQKYDVVNLALPGYTSLQGRIVLQKHIDKIKPVLVIASFSFNDRRYVLDERTVDSEDYFKQVYRNGYLIPRLSRYSYILRYMYEIVQGDAQDAGSLPSGSGGEFHVQELHPRVSPDAYRENLEEIVDIARGSGARIILLSLADSPKRARELYRGITLIEEGRPDDAAEALLPVAEGTSVFSTLAKRFLRELFEQRGRHADAQKLSRIDELIVSLHGGKPLFLDVEYARIMEQVALARSVTFVDGTTSLKEHPEYFMDFSHFNENGHRLIADLLEGKIESR